MSRLFLSYRRADSPDTVGRLYEQLRQRLPRWDVFYDHQTLEPGAVFPDRLREAVAAADAVLVVIGPRWVESLTARAGLPDVDHVRAEVALALEAGHTVIPLLVEHAAMPRESQLEAFPDLAPLVRLAGRMIRPDPDFTTDVERLAGFLDQIGPGIGPGAVVGGKYKILRTLATGGMGVVYEAQQLGTNQRVALKMILEGMDTREVLARFDGEKEALARMDHPNIAGVVDSGMTSGGRPFFVMELVRGEPITAYCDHRRLSPRERLRLFQQVCHAVQHAHQKGILHRDLKPSNVLVEEVDGRPVPKVIDFGLAKALAGRLTDRTIVSELGRTVGTLLYSSPEQAAGRAFDIDTRSDVYSLGVLLYELLAGEPPFGEDQLLAAGEEAMRREIQEAEPSRPSAKLSSSKALPVIAERRQLEPKKLTQVVRGDLDWIVLKTLRKDPRERYDSATALAEDIQRHLEVRPILARAESPSARARKWIRRNRQVAALLGLAATAIVLGLVGTSVGLIRARRFARESSVNAARATASAARATAEAKRALTSERAARAAEKQALDLADLSSQRLYDVRMNQVQRHWEDWDGRSFMMTLLQQGPDLPPDGIDRRGFEWHYWNRMEVSGSRFLGVKEESCMSVAWRRDDPRVVSGWTDGKVRIWNPENREAEEILVHDPQGRDVLDVEVSTDGLQLATCGEDRRVVLWDMATGQEVRSFVGHEDDVRRVLFTPDRNQLISGGDDDTIRVWDRTTGEQVRRLDAGMSRVLGLAISPDGTLVIASGHSGVVAAWELASGAERFRHETEAGWVVDLAISADGQRLASAGDDATIWIWDLKTGQPSHRLDAEEVNVDCVAYSPDGKVLYGGLESGRVMRWSEETGDRLPNLQSDHIPIRDLEASADGKSLATASLEVRVWDVVRGQEPRTFRKIHDRIHRVVFSPDGRIVAAGEDDGATRLWDLESGAELRALEAHRSWIQALDFRPDGKQIVTASYDKTAIVWEVGTGRRLATLTGHDEGVEGVDFCPDGKWIATASQDGTARIWDAETGKPLRTLSGHHQRVNGVAFSSDGKRLFTVDQTDTLRTWDARTGELLGTCAGNSTDNTLAVFNPDRTLLATEEYSGLVVREVATGNTVLTLSGHTSSIEGAAFSPDGQRIATASYDRIVKLWDTRTGQETLSLAGHEFSALDVAFSPDGHLLASSDWQGTIRVWDGRPLPRESPSAPQPREASPPATKGR